ncbi:MAG: hydrolase [Gemmatales bacterium]|nr:MAG: hydrolase [Gemmatales bacterium]
MDQLWAPWRLAYVTQEKKPTNDDPCFICRGLGEKQDRKNLIVHRSERGVVLLNRFPYNNGHLLIAPQAHKGEVTDLSPEELLDTLQLIQQYVAEIKKLMSPDGFNIGLNQGAAAGAGLPGHLHWHVVPRWHGDTNFMPVFSDVKVIVQSLDALYSLLTDQPSSQKAY